LGDPGIDGRIILRLIFRKWDIGDMVWIELAQDRDTWRVLVAQMDNMHTVKKVAISKARIKP
jgi:hypothetical protein